MTHESSPESSHIMRHALLRQVVRGMGHHDSCDEVIHVCSPHLHPNESCGPPGTHPPPPSLTCAVQRATRYPPPPSSHLCSPTSHPVPNHLHPGRLSAAQLCAELHAGAPQHVVAPPPPSTLACAHSQSGQPAPAGGARGGKCRWGAHDVGAGEGSMMWVQVGEQGVGAGAGCRVACGWRVQPSTPNPPLTSAGGPASGKAERGQRQR